MDWATSPEATLWHTGFTGTFSLVPGSLGIGAILPSSTTHNPDLAELDILDVPDLVALMAAESNRACDAVVAATRQIAEAVTAVARRLAEGGRLIYIGAGTAGRLGVLDAAETGPTFDVPDGLVLAVFAGGSDAMVRPREGVEDDSDAPVVELRAGLLASRRRSRDLGERPNAVRPRRDHRGTSHWSAHRRDRLQPRERDRWCSRAPDRAPRGRRGDRWLHEIERRDREKITLNILSTAVMIQLGKTYGNLMVDVPATNEKLRDRATRIVATVAKASPERARKALEDCAWQTKPACLVAATTMGAQEAVELLAASGGRLRAALEAAHVGQRFATGRPFSRSGDQRRLGVTAFLQHGRLVPGDIAIEDGHVVALGLTPGNHGIAIPGLVDLQVNGYAGVDMLSASVEELAAVSRALARDGVLAFQPTLISSETARTKTAAGHIADLSRREQDGARILGIHLEGPFLSPLRAGTHPAERLARPDLEHLRSLCDAGPVTMVTLAPELPGALDLVAECRRRGIIVSFGHSDADASQARRGFDAGGQAVTHIFNAMSPISARSPGLAGAALADPRVTVQIIADQVHLADDVLRLVLAAAAGRWTLVSDATAASSLGDGELVLGEVRVMARHGVVRRQDGTIAGSAAKLLDGVRRVADTSTALGNVLAAVSERPAALLGRGDIGRIRLGARADLVVLGDDLDVREVLLEGRSLS